MEEAASAIAGYLTDIDANGYNFCKPKWRNRQTRTTQTRVGKPVWVRLPPSAQIEEEIPRSDRTGFGQKFPRLPK